MFKMWILLVWDTFDIFLYIRPLIEGRGNNRYEREFLSQLLSSSISPNQPSPLIHR